MRLKLVKPVSLAGHPGLVVGSIFESDDRSLLEWCVEVEAVAPRFVEEIETRVPVIENRDPQPAVKRAKKVLP